MAILGVSYCDKEHGKMVCRYVAGVAEWVHGKAACGALGTVLPDAGAFESRLSLIARPM